MLKRVQHDGVARLAILTPLLMLIAIPGRLIASEGEKPQAVTYAATPPAPQSQTPEQAKAKSAGCISCHSASDAWTMHKSEAVVLGCVDCHGGNAGVFAQAGLKKDDPAYVAARDRAHVLPRYPHAWNWPSSANPKRSYTLLNREAPEFIRFVNPSDYRVARASCGACHLEIIEASERSLMSTGAMLWGGAAYNNGILPYKSYVTGEAYTKSGDPAKLLSPGNPPGTVTPQQAARGALPALYPLPTWQTVPPGDIFRVFERGGRTIGTQFPEIGLPNPSGSIQRLEEDGRPDLKQSNRGPGTGLRVAIPVLNIHKTRLNDPYLWFQGTNDQPGDYRQSGCAGCHVVYANDRDPKHSLTWAPYGRDGQTGTLDPTISGLMQKAASDLHGVPAGHPITGEKESGHPIEHAFTRAIPTAQCMVCHMHQPNIFLNSYLGYTMWDYESDAPLMWPEKQKYPTAAEVREVEDRNPEGASPRGKWSDVDFLRHVYDDVNPKAKDTQFADYHGHGWNFRAIYKRDREGNLLDAEGEVVASDDPEKFKKAGMPAFAPVGQQAGKAVHLMDIHAEKGMQCADCHFAQDAHGNGLIYGEVANAVEIGCKDCHGTADAFPNLRTSGPAARPGGTDLSLLRNSDGKRRFEWSTGAAGERILIQRSIVDPKIEWRVSLVRNSVDRSLPEFNAKAARAKLMGKAGVETGNFAFGPGVKAGDRAHDPDKMACFTCHLSWTTSCGGCHLPIEANWKTKSHHFGKEGEEETRNFATYNPQVARDDMFQLGLHMTTKGNEIAPIRSTSALILSSTNINRERIYVQQPPISAIGFSSQAFAPHFPHTVRTTETKTCSDCHLSAANDNNAIMAQLMLLGTGSVNFVGMNAWLGLEGGIEAVRVTEWQEPQAVIGSYLQKYAYPDYYRLHVDRNKRELINWNRGRILDKKGSGERDPVEPFRNIVQGGGLAGCIQMRGEYMFVAEGTRGFRAYDVASIANKGFSEKIVTAPFSPLSNSTHVASSNATCMALPTNQPINPLRNTPAMRAMNQEQAFDPIYHYAAVTDAKEGLILVNVDTLADGDPRNNVFKRAVTWNPGNVLAGARHITLAGHVAYIAAEAGLVVVDLADPLQPKLAATVSLPGARASAIQFRYLWVTTAEGLRVLDITHMLKPRLLPALVPLADARRVYVARTYAYVAAGKDGLVIVNVTNPEAPLVYARETFGGQMTDASDVIVGSTNASLFAYVADGKAGMKVIQLTSPASQPNFYGFSPAPKPELIAWAKTPTPARAISRGLDRDRGVDETGGQIAVFGRLGSRPFTRPEMERFFLNSRGVPWKVSDAADLKDWAPR
ncbi:multiheme c-type cytochrome [Sphingomonas sp. MMS24-J13]|uniref:multiheme c-type cytochrome n=1 Tax=Sphingomonas sp. MMS24-J13 TaxID=3238686 RepID=UPI00384B3A38